MELFRFIAWQYNRFDFEEISLILSALVAMITPFVVNSLGFNGGWIFASIFISFFVFISISALVYQTRVQWRKYKEFKEKEAQKIVDKLRGTSYRDSAKPY